MLRRPALSRASLCCAALGCAALSCVAPRRAVFPPPQELDTKDPLHVDFWSGLSVVADHVLAEATKQEEIDRARWGGGRAKGQAGGRVCEGMGALAAGSC